MVVAVSSWFRSESGSRVSDGARQHRGGLSPGLSHGPPLLTRAVSGPCRARRAVERLEHARAHRAPRRACRPASPRGEQSGSVSQTPWPGFVQTPALFHESNTVGPARNALRPRPLEPPSHPAVGSQRRLARRESSGNLGEAAPSCMLAGMSSHRAPRAPEPRSLVLLAARERSSSSFNTREVTARKGPLQAHGTLGRTAPIRECRRPETHARQGDLLNHGPVHLCRVAAFECLCHSAARVPYEVDYAGDGPRSRPIEAERQHG